MKSFVAIFFFLLSTLIHCLPACSQTVVSTPELDASIALQQQHYITALSNSPTLYNGPEYINYALRYNTRTSHQFFTWPEKQPGSVNYNGQYFTNLLLAYDIVFDQLVLPFPDSPFMLRLLKENVSNFTINEHHFVRLWADSVKGSPITTGYYEVLNSGKAQALAKHTKRLQEQIRQTKLEADFPESSKLFLTKGGVYYSISSKKDILRVFSDHEKEMQAYIQNRKIKFKKSQLKTILLELTLKYNTLVSA